MFHQYCLGVDVSSWQTTVEWDTLHNSGVRFAMVKAAQGKYLQDPICPTHLKNARATGMITGVYHWMDPVNKPEDQLTNLSSRLEGLDFDFLALDVEQYWSDWVEWKNGSIKSRFTPKLISDCALACAMLMRDQFQKQVLIYTRASFVKEYAPQMSTWLNDWPLWLAHYPYRSGRINLTWEQLKNEFSPSIPAPAIPEGCSDWKFWQFSGDKFILPGEQTALDLNFYHGSLQDLQTWLGQPVTPRELSLEEKLEVLWNAYQANHKEVSHA